MNHGVLVEIDGRPAIRFQRTYPQPTARIWSAIADPAELSHWFPARVSLDPRVGGVTEFSDDPNVADKVGTVLAFAPPHRLAYMWGSDELHFELVADETGGCLLTFINVLAFRNDAALKAAGWSVCLAELDKHIAGAVAQGPHSDMAEPWQQHYDNYVANGMPARAVTSSGHRH